MMERKDNIKKRKSRIMAGACLLCTGSLCFTALASSEGPSSNVWLDVVQVSSEARISVTVPMSYGFAVVGSTSTTATGPVSVSDGNLLLSNIRVVVTDPSNPWTGSGTPGTSTYEVQTVGAAAVALKNYSTDVREEDLELEEPPREGLPVSLKPYIVNETGSDHYWQSAGVTPTVADADFKKYQMVLDGKQLSEAVAKNVHGTVKNGFQMNGVIDLPAPEDVPTNGHTAAGTANQPSETYITVGVNVGGRQNQYKQVEQSVKVGSIYWEIIPGELPPTTP